MSVSNSLPWRDRVAIGRHELMCAAIVIRDVLDKSETQEPDWQRLVLAFHRLSALVEAA